MAKIKSTLTGPAKGQSAAYDRIRHREDCISTTRDGTSVHAQVNSRSIHTLVESSSVRTTDVYDWRKGTFEKKKLDIVENARANINTFKVRPVTNARARENDDKGNGMAGYGYCSPCPPMGRRK